MHVYAAELDDLRHSVREFAAGPVAASALRRIIDGESTGGKQAEHDSRAWDVLTTMMGLSAIGIPEAYGGAGYSFTEVGVVLEELGGALAPVPFLSSAVIAPAALLCCAGEEAKAKYLPGIAEGATIATVALGGFPSWPMPEATIKAIATPGGHHLTGHADYVLDARAASLLLTVAALDNGWGLFAVDAAGPGVTRIRHAALDVTRPMHEVEFDAAEAALIGQGPANWPELAGLVARISAALACEQVGGMASCLEATVGYVKTRAQFGRPIGSFQAIKHRCADLLVELEAARSVAYEARDLAAENSPELLAAAAAAKSWCADAYVHAAQEAIQFHGAIGFTWEHDAHLHLRRARSGQLLFGTPRAHRRALADAMGI